MLNAPNDQPLSTSSQLDNIQYLNAKVNSNLKEISELIREKGRLISKVHVASIDVSGLPHLNVSELALTKCLTTNIKSDNASGTSEENRQRLREFRDAGILLDARVKWLRKKHVFFDWMVNYKVHNDRRFIMSDFLNNEKVSNVNFKK